MADESWIEASRRHVARALEDLSPEGAVLERQLRRWLLGAPGDPLRPPRDERVLTRARARALRALPLGTVDRIDALLFLHALDAEPEPHRDDHLDAWRPFVDAALSGADATNPARTHPWIPAGGRALSALLASLRASFRVGFYAWERAELPRRWVLQARGSARLRLARYVLANLKGFGPLWTCRLLPLPPDRHLTEDAFLRSHLEVARLMQHAPEIRGIASASWFYDPAIETISPRLGFLGRVVAWNGGLTVELPCDEATRQEALATSRARRTAAGTGRYRPRKFARVWARRPFLAWAAHQQGWQLEMTISA